MLLSNVVFQNYSCSRIPGFVVSCASKGIHPFNCSTSPPSHLGAYLYNILQLYNSHELDNCQF
uniref:Uncharacterized protein n=1 Tax=Arundo donax TaxID=35708 RepID=A0A0A9F6F5_ARUDO